MAAAGGGAAAGGAPAGVLFDLDGTLVDSAPDILAAANATLADLRLPAVDLAAARGYIGDGMPRFIKRLLTRQWWGEPDADMFRRASDSMRRHYARECVGGRLYPGVPETLRRLRARSVRMACVTNKPAQFTAPLLAARALDGFFDKVVCGDTLAVKKPHPQPLLAACDALRLPAADVVMVGDSVSDSGAAAAAGCRFIAVSYGYHRDGVLPPADAVIDRFADLPAAIWPPAAAV